MSLAERLLLGARRRGAILATAESCTAGLIAAAITEPAGASDVFDRGFVTYSNAAKRELLGVRQATLDAHGAVSEPVAREMAEGARHRSDATLIIAVTGIAGPGGTSEKPEGRVCFALARRDGETVAETVEFGALGRSAVRDASVAHALKRLLGALDGDPFDGGSGSS